MNLSQLAGATSGLVAAGLAVLGLVVLLLVSARLPFVLRRPGKGRVAKAFAAAALVLLVCGVGLFLAADLTDAHPSFRHLLDAAAPWLGAVVLVAALLAAIRTGRRRFTAPAATAAPEDSPPPTAAPGPGSAAGDR